MQESTHLNSNKMASIEIVGIGGGTGLATLLRGLKTQVETRVGKLSAIVAVTDDGGSSGRLRDEFKMPPPGDIRNCMVALSEDEHLLSRLFQYRFTGTGSLGGHSFGNLFLAALSEITGDFSEAIRLSSGILASKGHIYPASVSNVSLVAELEDGTTVNGETNISQVGPKIELLRLVPSECEPHPNSIKAIYDADIITIGPGSLFTSILPPLLVPGIANAIAESSARKVFICNLMTQPGETDGLNAKRHLEVFRRHLPQLEFDAIIVNETPVTAEQLVKYSAEGAEQIGVHGSIDASDFGGAEIVRSHLLADGDLVRHDPVLLADVVLDQAARSHKHF